MYNSNTRSVAISKDSHFALMLLIARYLHLYNLFLAKRLWYSYHYIPCKKKKKLPSSQSVSLTKMSILENYIVILCSFGVSSYLVLVHDLYLCF